MEQTKKIALFFTLLLSLIISYSCVQSLTENPTQKPTIKVTSPASGDTVQVGKNLITYSAYDWSGGTGMARYEIFINGYPVEQVEQNENGTNPELNLNINEAFLGQLISYHVTAYNQDGQYAISEEMTNIFVAAIINPPDKPLNLEITMLGDTDVLLDWIDSSHTADYFEVWRKDDESGNYRVVKDRIDANEGILFSYREYGLSPFVVYYYKVRGINSIGPSEFSNEVNTVFGGAPTNLTAEANGASIVHLTWQDNALDENGFKVERMMQASSEFVEIVLLPPDTEEYTDTGLLQNTTYRYRVGAITNSAVAYSNEATVTTYSQDIPAPSNLTATYNSFDHAVDITWTDNTYLENGTLIERKEGVTGDYHQIGSSAPDVASFKDYNITLNRTYFYRARHTTTEGFLTEYSNEDSVYIPVTPPNAPSNLRITSTTQTDVFVLDWQDNSTDEDGFELYAKKGINGTWASFSTYPANYLADSVKVSDPTAEYFFKLRSFRGGLNSGFSNEVSTKGTASGFTITLVTVTTSFVEMSWQDIFDGEFLFEVERRKTSWPPDSNFVSVGSAAAIPGVGGYQNFIDTDSFTSFDTYLYRVRAKFATGYSDYSNELSVTIP